MIDTENSKKDAMYAEALERMELLGIDEEYRQLFFIDRKFIKAVVNHDKRLAGHVKASYEEIRMVKEWEKEKNSIVYYMIQDEGMWPDGCKFQRYTLLYVNSYTEEYKMQKENTILRFGMVPAYVINVEEPKYSEYGEMCFQNEKGVLINLS